MIRCLFYTPQSGLQQASSAAQTLIARWQSEPDALLWLDLQHEAAPGEAELLGRLGVHPLAIEDAQRKRHPPKLELFDAFLFVLLRGLDADSDGFDLTTLQLSFFVGKRILITRHDGRSRSVDAQWEQALEAGMLAPPLQIAVQTWDMVCGRYLPILFGLEARLGELEDQLMSRPSDDLLTELTGYKTRLRRARRNFSYHERIFSRLLKDTVPGMDEELMHKLADVYELSERLRSLSDMYYEVTGDLIEGYISLASHRLNQIMKVLTIVTTIFVPLGFLAGIYGMNFEYMPELSKHNGYFVLLGVMASIATGLMLMFRWRRWL